MLRLEAREHLENYWRLARGFFEEADFALAAFFAITLMEEVGKIIVWRNKELVGELNRKAFYSHQKKYAQAVFNTLFVNARVSRVYGSLESKFAAWFSAGKLFDIRNHALYLELGGDDLIPPKEAVAKEDAFLLVCIAGEVYAEIQGFYTGTGPTEWERVLREVDGFRNRHAV